MKRVVLVRPSYSGVYKLFKDKSRTPIVPPIGLGYIASVLRGGTYDGDSIRKGEASKYDPIIIDNEILKQESSKLADLIVEYHPIMVGISAATTSFYEALGIAKAIKERSNIYTCLGGTHATSLGEGALKEGEYFDCLIQYEGEYTLLELLEALENKSDLKKVSGLIYREDDKVVINNLRPLIPDLDRLPLQAYDLLDMKQYNHLIPGYGMNPMGALLTSRGCPQTCHFCFNQFGKSIRFKSPQKVLEEIEYLLDNFDVKWLTLYDDSYTWPDSRYAKKGKYYRVKQISRGLKKLRINIPYQIFMRANSVDEQTVNEIVDSGCKVISIGIESGCDTILKNAGKGVNQKIIKNALEILNKFYPNIEIRGSIILGLPGETHSTVQKTMDLLKEIKIQRVNVNIATPYPGTKMYDMAIKGEDIAFIKGAKKDWERFRRHGNCLINTGDLNSEDLINYQKEAHTLFYSRPDILKHHFNMIKECIKHSSSLKSNSYYFRPFVFALKELYNYEDNQQYLKTEHRKNSIKLTDIDAWENKFLMQENGSPKLSNKSTMEIIEILNKEFGFGKKDITPKGESDFVESD